MTHSHPQGGERGGGGLHKLEPKGTPPISRTLASTILVSYIYTYTYTYTYTYMGSTRYLPQAF